MHGKLGDDIVRHEVHLARRFHLLHGIVPLRADLVHLLGGRILHGVLLVLVSVHQPNDLSRPRNYGGMQAKMATIGEDELIECDSELMGGGEVLVQRIQYPGAGRDRGNLRDVAGGYRANGNNEMVEHIEGLHDAPCDRLTCLSYPHFLVEGDLQWGAVGDGHCDSAGGWLRCGGLCRQISPKGAGNQK